MDMDDMGESVRIRKQAIWTGIMGTWEEAWDIARTDSLLNLDDVNKDKWVKHQKKLLKTRIDAND